MKVKAKVHTVAVFVDILFLEKVAVRQTVRC